jgi:selenocysteine-specific elongation factor
VLERGDVLASPASNVRPTFLLDAALEVDDPGLSHGSRVQVHHGTRAAPARMAWLGGAFWQVRLEQPLIAAAGDRLVIRRIAPPDTVGGGVVLDAHPRKHGPSRAATARLQRLARGEPPDPPAPTDLPAHPDANVTADPHVTGQHRAKAPASDEPQPPAVPVLTESAGRLEARLRAAGTEPPLDSELDPGDLAALRAAGRAVRVSRTLHYHADVLAEIRERVTALAQRRGSFTLADVRDELGTSRKFAQALLEHFDAQRLTLRRGEDRVLRRHTTPQ